MCGKAKGSAGGADTAADADAGEIEQIDAALAASGEEILELPGFGDFGIDLAHGGVELEGGGGDLEEDFLARREGLVGVDDSRLPLLEASEVGKNPEQSGRLISCHGWLTACLEAGPLLGGGRDAQEEGQGEQCDGREKSGCTHGG